MEYRKIDNSLKNASVQEVSMRATGHKITTMNDSGFEYLYHLCELFVKCTLYL